MGKQKLIMLNDKSTILKLIFSVFIAFQLNCSSEQNSKFNVNYDLQGDYCISFTYINNNLEELEELAESRLLVTWPKDRFL